MCFWWLFALVALFVRLKLGSPVIFHQTRPGRNEEPFGLCKFRTMTDERDEKGELLPDSVRLTPFGTFLRKTSLDELPEIWNIFKGDMSFIGPRPLLMGYLPYYREEERVRHSVRPGLTGLAQVSGRNFLGWDERLATDVEYVNSISFLKDIEIIFKTVAVVLKPSNVAADTETVEPYLWEVRKKRPECTEQPEEKSEAEPVVETDLVAEAEPVVETDLVPEEKSTANKIQGEFDTPCYILHLSKLDAEIDKLKAALKEYWPNSCYGYSVKTNGLPWFVNYARTQGFMGEVVSSDEYYLVRNIGFEPKKIIFNGPVKDYDAFLEAIGTGAIVNIDSNREIEWLESNLAKLHPETRIGIRCNFNVEKECPGESSGDEFGSRFGFSYENGDWKRAWDRLVNMGITPAGVHMHVGSHTRSIGIYEAIARQAVKLKREYNIEFGFIDIGGGYFGGMENRPQYKDYLAAVSKILVMEFDKEKTMLIMEPGTSLVSAPFEYVTRVVDVKDTYASRIVTVDGSRNDVDPLHTKKSYFMDIVSNDGTEASSGAEVTSEACCQEGNHPKQLVYGYTCMESDRLMILEEKPELKTGDEIHLDKVGGYTMCLTPLFIKYFPKVYLEKEGKLSVIRDKWTPKEYLMKSELPKEVRKFEPPKVWHD